MAGMTMTDDLRLLAAGVSNGDPDATEEFRMEMTRRLLPRVRRTMQIGRAVSPLDERILAEAEQLALPAWEVEEEFDQVETQVALRISNSMVERMRPKYLTGWSGKETVCN